MSARVRVASAAGACVVAGVTTTVGVTQGAPVRFLVLDGVLGLLFVVAGAVAWRRRPDVRTGPLLTACAVLWFVGSYAPTGIGWLSALGIAFERYYDLVLAALVLTFPGRRLTRPARWLLVAMGGAMLVRSAVRLLAYDGPTVNPGCAGGGCPSNPFAVLVSARLFTTTETVAGAVVVLTALGVAVHSVVRWRRAPAASRRVLWPVLAAGALAALASAWVTANVFAPHVLGRPLVVLEPPWHEVHAWSLIAVRALIPLGFLVGVLRLRSPQGPAGRLAVEVGAAGPPDDLGPVLRRSLGDPTVQVLRHDAASGTWTGERGEPVPAPVAGDGRAVLLLETDGAPVAAVVHDAVLLEDAGLLASVSAVLRLVVENERLTRELRHQLEEVRASRARLVAAGDEARRRIERDLHDGAQQQLLAVYMALKDVRQRSVRAGVDGELMTRIDTAATDLRAAMSDVRELARGIHPAVLSTEGCVAAVRALVRRSVVPVELHVDVDGRLPAAVEVAAYYVVAEGLANLTRHARATRAEVCLRHHDGVLVVEVHDDGVGGADPDGSGLRGLADRVAAVGGALAVSDRPGGGTWLRAELPCA